MVDKGMSVRLAVLPAVRLEAGVGTITVKRFVIDSPLVGSPAHHLDEQRRLAIRHGDQAHDHLLGIACGTYTTIPLSQGTFQYASRPVSLPRARQPS